MHGPDPISFTYTTKEGGPYKLDLSNGRTHKSRETWGVWVHKDRAWKIFPGVDQWERVKNDYTTATARGLPTPSYELHQGTLSYSHNRTKEVATKEGFALITKYIAQPPARFFALKNGIKALKGLIAPITNDDILSKYVVDHIKRQKGLTKLPQDRASILCSHGYGA